MEALIPIFAILIATFLSVVTMWDLFKAAGEEAWKSLIPIYNIIVLLKISDLPLYWLIVFLIPLGQIVVFIVVFKRLVDEYRDEIIKVLVANIAAIIVAGIGIVYGAIMSNNENAAPENGNIVNVEKPNTDTNTNTNTNINDIYDNINNNNIKNPSENTTTPNDTNVDNQVNNNLTNEPNVNNNIVSSEVAQDTDYTGKRVHLYDNMSSQNKIQKDKQKRIINRIKDGFIIIPKEPINNFQENTQNIQNT